MRVIQHAPAARGVNQLMYVGDDQPVESASGPTVSTSALVAIAAIGLLGWLMFGGGARHRR